MKPKALVLVLATLLLLSAWFGVCMVYKLIGLTTAKVKVHFR